MGPPTFRDRAEAGRFLGERLASDLGSSGEQDVPVVLGLPRGGVVVAAHVAAVLGVPVEVFVARKIGHPRQPEYGIGALAEDGEPVFDQVAVARAGLSSADLTALAAAEGSELARRVQTYRGGRALPVLRGRTVVVVDDGVATGVTARAALRSLRGHEPRSLLLAAPVGSADSLADLRRDADDVVVLSPTRELGAVARWYADFSQVSDAEVLALLPTRPGRRSR
jgi:putative phosphoribosyl transferase